MLSIHLGAVAAAIPKPKLPTTLPTFGFTLPGMTPAQKAVVAAHTNDTPAASPKPSWLSQLSTVQKVVGGAALAGVAFVAAKAL